MNRLQSLLAELLQHNRFYGAKLRAAGVHQPPATLEEYSRCVPFTTKRELVEDQQTHPPYGTNLTYPLARYTRFAQTSATTGKPLRWLDTPETWNWMVDCWDRVFDVAGVTAEDRVFFAFSFGPFLGFWLAFDSAARHGSLCIPGGGMRSAARLTAMIDNQATVLCCTPTYAIHLAEVAAQEGIDLAASSIRIIIAAGEPGASIPATRALMERLWNGARVVDHHGMTEIGPVSYECPARPRVLHVIEGGFIPEVIDPSTLQHVGPGGMGELVLTNLGRPGSPLLRYRTGDMVRRAAASPCACGSHEMALEGGILGRADDMVIVRGVNIYPGAVEDVVRSCGNIAEYRVEVSTRQGLIQLRILAEPTLDGVSPAELGHRLELALNNAFGLRIPVTLVDCGALPRFEMKARRWIRVPAS